MSKPAQKQRRKHIMGEGIPMVRARRSLEPGDGLLYLWVALRILFTRAPQVEYLFYPEEVSIETLQEFPATPVKIWPCS